MLGSIGDAVIATDVEGRVVLMNPTAESLCGWTQIEAIGKPLSEVFHIVNEKTRLVVESPVDKVFRDGQSLAWRTIPFLIGRDKQETAIDDSAAPIIDDSALFPGSCWFFATCGKRRPPAGVERSARGDRRSSNDIIVSKTLDGIVSSGTGGGANPGLLRRRIRPAFRCLCRPKARGHRPKFSADPAGQRSTTTRRSGGGKTARLSTSRSPSRPFAMLPVASWEHRRSAATSRC